MEAANNDVETPRTKPTCHIHGARELVALDAHQEDDARSRIRNTSRDTIF
jgi:hypothetical protein